MNKLLLGIFFLSFMTIFSSETSAKVISFLEKDRETFNESHAQTTRQSRRIINRRYRRPPGQRTWTSIREKDGHLYRDYYLAIYLWNGAIRNKLIKSVKIR